MSDTNADPDWTVEAGLEFIKGIAEDQLGQEISDDSALRCLNIIQTTMDITLAVSAEQGVPGPAQVDLAEITDELCHSLISEIFRAIADHRGWEADG